MINRFPQERRFFLYLIFLIIMLILFPAISFTDADKASTEDNKVSHKTERDWFNIGVGYSEMGMHKEAVENFRQAIKMKPDFAEAHLALGISYFYLNDRKSALEEYIILKGLNPQMAEELFKLTHH